jgi:hypothetical protein
MGLNYKIFGAWLRGDISAGAGLHGQVERSQGRQKINCRDGFWLFWREDALFMTEGEGFDRLLGGEFATRQKNCGNLQGSSGCFGSFDRIVLKVL